MANLTAYRTSEEWVSAWRAFAEFNLNRPCGLVPADGLADGGEYYTADELARFDEEELDKTIEK